MVRALHDRLQKDTLASAFAPACHRVLKEHEISADSLKVDVMLEPDPNSLHVLDELGMLRQIAELGPCALEAYHRAPSPAEVRTCIQKALLLNSPAYLRARRRDSSLPLATASRQPSMVIIAGGRPRGVMDTLGLPPDPTWTEGVYVADKLLRTRLIVVPELPCTPDTLFLRSLGRGRTLRQAVRELLANGSHHPVSRLIVPVMLTLRRQTRNSEFLMDTQQLFEEWQNEVEAKGKARGRAQGRAQGRAEGRADALLRVLEARNLPVSRNQLAKVRACTDIAVLDEWIVRAATADSTADVFR